ncbi:nitrate reductase molybdenum cofactor assembly chaperone [Lampropedia puyangensis]|uniref:Nitrate reductase molybdenum cofactor assembly chaperone n=1 Tax=Lampropedia puyangensis TaxID=1330072 RepID=A0A4S8EVZ9_9BURK|nr:nitrate reductase molybdenum cofactor assembly chaperone [Lampropedia puyangensis]THT98430.1 nitrate reductase molybdenum cofactor assembly chaperone [Lampropedia puyangensis]
MIYRILSALLSYPQRDLQQAIPEIRQALAQQPAAQDFLEPLLDRLASTDLIELQEDYVAVFDRTPKHSLHLFEHVHGESRDRGQAMVDLLQTYQAQGFEPVDSELPDHVPLFLEFLSILPADQALDLLNDAIHVLAAIGARLARSESAYSSVFAVLRGMATVEPREQEEPPVRDMDEAMETFGPGADGVEPLLRPAMAAGAAQPLQFYRSRPTA